jgi:16S rRNA (guanine527-N7)-methyltransferase
VPASPTNVPRETQERLDEFVSLLSRWNRTLNLVSKADIAHGIGERHIAQSLVLVDYLPQGLDRFIDLGSGGGFPALPIAIATGVYVDLVESDHRKGAFLETALTVLGVRGKVWAQRIEVCQVPPAKCVTARALAPLPLLLSYTYPLLQPDGVALFLKGDRAEAEIDAARANWQMQADIIDSVPNGSRILKISRLKPGHDPSR